MIEDARPISGFPDYAVTADGAVYRVTPYSNLALRMRLGDTPRLLKPCLRGGWVQHRQPSVTLIAPDGRHCQRLVGKLVREVWGGTVAERSKREG